MNVWSLFTGVGGFDLGLERAGMHVALQCEWDEWRRRVLRERFPGRVVVDDVSSLRVESAPRGAGDGCGSGAGETSGIHAGTVRPRLLCGGFPCQDLSVAGRRAGLDGERSGLFFEFARIADELRLAERDGWVFLENVPGLLSSHGGRDFGVVLQTLADLGFAVAYRVLDSRYFGVPQRRRRVFIVGHPRADYARAVLFEREGSPGDPAASGEAWPESPLPSLSGLGSGGPDDNDAQGGRLVIAPDEARCLTSRVTRIDGDTETFIVFHSTQDPISSSDFTPALSKGNKQGTGCLGVAGEFGVRRLTPVECERLQGFPDNWTAVDGEPTYVQSKNGSWRAKTGTPDNRRYAAMGDAVTVNVIEWIGRRILAVDSGALEQAA